MQLMHYLYLLKIQSYKHEITIIRLHSNFLRNNHSNLLNPKIYTNTVNSANPDCVWFWWWWFPYIYFIYLYQLARGERCKQKIAPQTLTTDDDDNADTDTINGRCIHATQRRYATKMVFLTVRVEVSRRTKERRSDDQHIPISIKAYIPISVPFF